MNSTSFGSTVDNYLQQNLPTSLHQHLDSDSVITGYRIWAAIFILNDKHDVMRRLRFKNKAISDFRLSEAMEKTLESGKITEELGKITDLIQLNCPNVEDFHLLDGSNLEDGSELQSYLRAAVSANKQDMQKNIGDNGLERVQRKVGKLLAEAFAKSGHEDRALAELKIQVSFCKMGNWLDEKSIHLEKKFLRECDFCHKMRSTKHKLSKCSDCLKAFYCNQDCQKLNWQQHRRICLQHQGLTFCHVCLKVDSPDLPDQKIQRCAKCLTTAYCSKVCQRADWNAHKVVCQQAKDLH